MTTKWPPIPHIEIASANAAATPTLTVTTAHLRVLQSIPVRWKPERITVCRLGETPENPGQDYFTHLPWPILTTGTPWPTIGPGDDGIWDTGAWDRAWNTWDWDTNLWHNRIRTHIFCADDETTLTIPQLLWGLCVYYEMSYVLEILIQNLTIETGVYGHASQDIQRPWVNVNKYTEDVIVTIEDSKDTNGPTHIHANNKLIGTLRKTGSRTLPTSHPNEITNQRERYECAWETDDQSLRCFAQETARQHLLRAAVNNHQQEQDKQ